MTPLQEAELAAAKAAARELADKSGYGSFVTDDEIESICIVIVNAVDAVRATQPPTA